MTFRSRIATALGAVALAAAAAYAPAAVADRVGFSLSVGGPGYAVSVGNYGGYYDRYYVAPPPVYYAPAPVYRPYYPPAPVYRPYYAPVVVAPPVVVRPYPVYRPYYRDRYWDRRDVRQDRHERWHDRQDWRR